MYTIWHAFDLILKYILYISTTSWSSQTHLTQPAIVITSTVVVASATSQHHRSHTHPHIASILISDTHSSVNWIKNIKFNSHWVLAYICVVFVGRQTGDNVATISAVSALHIRSAFLGSSSVHALQRGANKTVLHGNNNVAFSTNSAAGAATSLTRAYFIIHVRRCQRVCSVLRCVALIVYHIESMFLFIFCDAAMLPSHSSSEQKNRIYYTDVFWYYYI